MNAVNGMGNDYLNMVQRATQRNTVSHVVSARESGNPVDVEQLQSSNQALRDSARETGVDLYTQNLQRQAVETYANASQNNSYDTSASDDGSSSDVYTFDAGRVNDTLQTAQQRALGVAAYENLSESLNNRPERPEFTNPSTQPVNVYV